MSATDKGRPTRATLAALEKVYAAEIQERLPFQSKAKVYAALCDAGLLWDLERTFGTGALRAHLTCSRP